MFRITFIIALALLATGCRNAQHYLDSGKQHATQGEWAEAVLDFQKAIQKEPTQAEAHFQLGEAFLKQNNWRSGLPMLARATELQAGNTTYRRRFTDVVLTLYLSDPRHPQAFLDRLQKLSSEDLAKDPKSPDGLRVRGFIYLTDGKYDLAMADFKQVLAARPGDAEISLAMSKPLMLEKRFAEAEKLLREGLAMHPDAAELYTVLYAHLRSTGQTEAAEQLLEDQVTANPRSVEAYLRLASHYYDTLQSSKVAGVLNQVSDARKFPEGPVAVSRFYARYADWKSAAAMMDSALSQAPERRTVWRKEQMSLLVAQGKFAEVRPIAEELLKENAQDAEALSVRGSLLMASSKPEDLDAARKDFEAIMTLEPNDPVSRFKLGRIAQIRGDRPLARKRYEESAKLRASYLPPRMGMAEVLFEERQFTPALEQLDAVIQVDPRNPEVRLMRSAVLMELGRKASAQAEIQQVQREFPDYPAAELQAGYFALARKAYGEADASFRKVYTPGAPDIRALNGLVEVRLAQNNPEAAFHLMRQDLAKQPYSAAVRGLLAGTAARLGRFAEALKEYEPLVASQPESAAVRARYADLYRLMGNTDEAIRHYQKASELDTRSPGPAAMLGYLYATQKRFPEARTALEKARAAAPQDPEILNNLAYLLAEMRADLPTAAGYAQTAMRLNPQTKRYRHTLGWIHAQSKQYDQALPLLQETVREEPGNALYRFHLAVVLLEKGDRARAKKYLTEALGLKPDKDDEGRIKELLSKVG
jgi:tetratricopeptide (TPR) repeat protein